MTNLELGKPKRVLSQCQPSLDLLDLQFEQYTKTPVFKEFLEKGRSSTSDPNEQVFKHIGDRIHTNYLRENGYSVYGEDVKKVSKESVSEDILKALEASKEVLLIRVEDLKKGRFSIRCGDGDYEISTTMHRDKIAKSGTVDMAKTIKPHTEEISDHLLMNYSVLLVKSNQILLELEDESQLSVKITKKKKELF